MYEWYFNSKNVLVSTKTCAIPKDVPTFTDRGDALRNAIEHSDRSIKQAEGMLRKFKNRRSAAINVLTRMGKTYEPDFKG